MIKFILKQQILTEGYINVDFNKLICELSEVSENYEDIISNDFEKLNLYLNKFKFKGEIKHDNENNNENENSRIRRAQL